MTNFLCYGYLKKNIIYWKSCVFNNQAGRSVEWPNAPTSKGAVRAENGPTGTVVKPLPGGEYLFLKFCIKINSMKLGT